LEKGRVCHGVIRKRTEGRETRTGKVSSCGGASREDFSGEGKNKEGRVEERFRRSRGRKGSEAILTERMYAMVTVIGKRGGSAGWKGKKRSEGIQ